MKQSNKVFIKKKLLNKLSEHYINNNSEIEKLFDDTDLELEKLFKLNHESIGRLLKCHLIIEHYINKFLEFELNLPNDNGANLRFVQKIILIEHIKPELKIFLNGAREINSIRNKIAHRLDSEIKLNKIETVKSIASWLLERDFINNNEREAIEYIEKYTWFFCHVIHEQSTELGKKTHEESNKIIRKGIKAKK